MIALFKHMLAAIALAAMHPGHAQVTYVQKVPSVDELKQMLSRQPADPTRSRGIQWTAGAAAGAAKPEEVPAASAPAQEQVSRVPVGPAVAMPITFDVSSSKLTGPSLGYVEVVAQLLARDPSLRLAVEGHTDASGNSSKNLVLSWDRALSVYKMLVERYGIDAQRLQPMGRGSLEPLEGVTPQAPMNRRVQFRVVG